MTQRIHRPLSVLIPALLMTLSWAAPAWAHGMGWQSDGSYCVAISFQYDDGEPMAFGSVRIYSPATDKYEYQGGRSDENGWFSFRPDIPGVWRFVGDDGQGHVTQGEIEVTAADLAGEATAVPRPVASGGAHKPSLFQILLGLSILLNTALASMWRQAKRRADPAGNSGGGQA